MSMPKVFLFSRKQITKDDIIVTSLALGVDAPTKFITPKKASDTIKQSMPAINNSRLVIFKDDRIQNLYCFGGDNLKTLKEHLEHHEQNTSLVAAMEEYIAIHEKQ